MSMLESKSRSRISIDDLARRVAIAGTDRRGFLALVAAAFAGTTSATASGATADAAPIRVGARYRLARGPQGRNPVSVALRATGEPVSRPYDGDRAASRGGRDGDASASKKRCAKEGKSCARKACCSWYVCLAGTCETEPAWKNTSIFGPDAQDEADRTVQPNAVVVDPSGRRAWIVDGGNNRVAIWQRTEVDPDLWVYAAAFGSLGSGPDQFDFPTCVDLTADLRTLVVADVNNDRVSVWTADGPDGLSWSPHSTFGTSGSGPGGLLSPFGARISGDGLTAWVADTGNNRISTWTRPGPASTEWTPLGAFGVAGDGTGELLAPNDLVVSADELAIYVADLLNDRISVWTRPDATGQAWTNVASFGTAGSLPDGVFVSADQLVAWASESGNDRVTMWSRPDADTQRWALVSSFGSAGSVAGEMRAPDGVWFSADGQTGWVADRLNNRMQVWQAVEGRAGGRRREAGGER